MDEAIADEIEMQAKLHGKEFKRPPKPLKVKEADKDFYKKQQNEMQKRLRKRYLEKAFKEKS